MTSLTTIPREFSLLPFWFWNDQLEEPELLRQIADFEMHGVYGFVIHPRMGLPRDLGWMSDRLLHFMRIAIEEAARRDMKILLYDEGMYPSGSSNGQVVAADPNLACRCLAIADDCATENIIARVPKRDGTMLTIVDRKADSVIRGLHYLDTAETAEEAPPAGDILNPATAAMVIRLVYDKFYQHFGEHFGKTILGVFTDEPSPLGRLREKNVRAGTTGIVQYVSNKLGYDFTPHLPALWFDDEPDAGKHRHNYDWAIHRRLEESWYAPLSAWCASKGVALCGHPDRGDEIGLQKYFQFPGQDLVWRWVLPDHPTALEGPESTQAKCSSSAALNLGRRRNSNEFCGAYGQETTFDEFKWLANWCLIRGVNLLIPHAFYYSVRGPRRDERPPQVGGVGCDWWDHFKPFADHCARLAWLNTDSQHVCSVAILTDPDYCPWKAAKMCFENQIDFNYLPTDHVGPPPIDYAAYIADGTPAHRDALQYTGDEAALLAYLDGRMQRDVRVDPPERSLRVRHVKKDGADYYLLFNECKQPIRAAMQLASSGEASWIETTSGEAVPAALPLQLQLAAYEMKLLRVM